MRLISRLSNGIRKMLKLPQRFIPPLISKLRNPHRNVRIFLIPLGFEVIVKIGIYTLLIPNGDRLEDDCPYFDENDAVVSNPPYSQPWDSTNKDADPRYARFIS